MLFSLQREFLKKQLEKTRNQKEKLEALCRLLQAERKAQSLASSNSNSVKAWKFLYIKSYYECFGCTYWIKKQSVWFTLLFYSCYYFYFWCREGNIFNLLPLTWSQVTIDYPEPSCRGECCFPWFTKRMLNESV